MKNKRFALLIFLLVSVFCVAMFSACKTDDSGNISVLFATEEDCPNGNVEDKYLKPAINFEIGHNYYIVIDYTYTAEEDGNRTDRLLGSIDIYPVSNVSATLEEAASSNFSEKVTDDEMNINISYSVPEKEGDEKAIRIIVRVTPVLPGMAYVKTSFYLNGVDGKYLCSKGVTINDNFSSGLEFSLNSDKSSYTVSDFDAALSGTVIIPSSYNGLPVTSIKKYAFYECGRLTSITIPDSITSIGDYAFRGCSGLTSINIPDSVTSIGWYTFSDCSALRKITIPDSVTSIGYNAFSGCSSMTSIIIPNSVTRVGLAAFHNCDSLTSVYFGGTESQWDAIWIIGIFDSDNCLKNATRYYYSEETPEESGNYWHYVNGEPVIW